MVEADFPKLLQEFQSVATDLNMKSNGINSTISICEQRIVNANAGIEYWLDRELMRDNPTADEKGALIYLAWRFGFAKVAGDWHLAVQQVTRQWYVEDLGGGQRDEGWCIREASGPMARSQASRELRIAALERLPDLIQRLIAEARRAITTIERAQKLVS